MRETTLARFAICLAVVGILSAPSCYGAPTAVFQSTSMTVTPSATFTTPAIEVQDAAGVTMVNLTVTLPEDVSVNTEMNGANLACVTQGDGVGSLFFSEWDSSARTISISGSVNAGSTIEFVKSIQFTTSSAPATSRLTLSGSVIGGSGSALFGTLTLVPPHAINITSASAVTPAEVDSGGTAHCTITAADSYGHGLLYLWSDGGKGGSFSPSATGPAPDYIAAQNVSGASIDIPITCSLTCSQNSTVTASSSVTLSLKSVPAKTIQVTSTPNASASISFSPESVGQASPTVTPCALGFIQTATGVQLTSAKQDGATHPLWFDHWTLDGVDQPQGTVLITLNMAGTDHTATAVYGKMVGDIDANGTVDSTDADLILKAVLGETTQDATMDVDQDGATGLKDAQWILKHTYP
ncbi:MAG: dockerin type I repeat-containing protein [Armatimonadetes bacterium]|nr:dockerin type I repeat-containing protein [Armatimonadota bacterium]